MALQGGVVVLFELPPQRLLLFERGEDAPPPTRGAVEREIPLPALLIFSHRLSVVRETERVSTTSLLGIPRSTAATALTLRSFE